jgi:magnesium-transporting ATPase (P-type)
MRIKNKVAEIDQIYDICGEFPFDSNRKRMSLIVNWENRYFLMTKGADSSLLNRCKFNN